jgi:hypothetical protein
VADSIIRIAKDEVYDDVAKGGCWPKVGSPRYPYAKKFSKRRLLGIAEVFNGEVEGTRLIGTLSNKTASQSIHGEEPRLYR